MEMNQRLLHIEIFFFYRKSAFQRAMLLVMRAKKTNEVKTVCTVECPVFKLIKHLKFF